MRAFFAALLLMLSAATSFAQTSPGLLQPGQIGANYTSSPGLGAANNWMASGTACPTWPALGQLFLNTSGSPTNDVLGIWDGTQCVAMAGLNTSTHVLSLGAGTATGSFANVNVSGQYQVGGAQLGYGNGVAGLGSMAMQNASSVNITGATAITGLPGPVNPSDAATKQYVDSIASGGLTVHTPSTVATTADLGSVTYNNGSSGVGATLTNAGTQAVFSTDGVSPAVNSRVLVKNESNTAYNGIYTLTTVGSGSTNWVLTRAADANTPGTGSPSQIGSGTYTLVTSGTTQTGTAWVVSSPVTTIGTSAITWTQFSAATSAAACGSTGQIQFNSSGVFGCSSNFTYSGTTATITGSDSTGGNLIINTPSTGQASDIYLNSAGTAKWQFGKLASDGFYLFDDVGNRYDMQIASNGNMSLMPSGGSVGIGNSSPIGTLDVGSPSTTTAAIHIDGANSGTNAGAALAIYNGGNGILYIGNHSAIYGGTYSNVNTFYSNSGSAFEFENGNVGIGIGTPLAKLAINGSGLSGNQLFVQGGSNNSGNSVVVANRTRNDNQYALYLQSGSANQDIWFGTNGNAGIGGSLYIGGGRPWVDVRSGANGCPAALANGGNDQSAIQCQLNWMSSNVGAGIVYLPCGSYTIGSSLVTNGVALIGETAACSTITTGGGDFTAIAARNNSAQQAFSGIAHLQIICNQTTGAGAACLEVDNYVDSIFTDLYIGGGAYSLYVCGQPACGGASYGGDNTFDHVRVQAFGSGGASLYQYDSVGNWYYSIKADAPNSGPAWAMLILNDGSNPGLLSENYISKIDLTGNYSSGSFYVNDSSGNQTVLMLSYAVMGGGPPVLGTFRFISFSQNELGNGTINYSNGNISVVGSVAGNGTGTVDFAGGTGTVSCGGNIGVYQNGNPC